jgi:hypothetical protein
MAIKNKKEMSHWAFPFLLVMNNNKNYFDSISIQK